MKDLNGNKIKHDHKFSNILKEFILAIVMLAPFLGIFYRCIYATQNPNAINSYSNGEIVYLKKITEPNSLIENETYTIKFNPEINTNTYSPTYFYNDITINWTDYDNNIVDNSLYIGFRMNRQQNGTTYIYLYTEIGDTYTEMLTNVWGNTLKEFTITLNQVRNDYLFQGGAVQILYLTYEKLTLDNTFTYAIEQSKKDELLKWTKTTPIYNVINSMNTGLGLSNDHILTYLLTYWSIILAIYIVFDIIIFAFTKITHYLQ